MSRRRRRAVSRPGRGPRGNRAAERGRTGGPSCASGCGIVALAIAGLFIHELSTERVIHSLDVVDSSALDPEPAPIQG